MCFTCNMGGVNLAHGCWVPHPTPKVPPRCQGGQTCSIYPGWMGLEHLKGGGWWEGVGMGGLVRDGWGKLGSRERVGRGG